MVLDSSGPSRDISFTGQIAKLTGGETGNKSPLGVEMYVSQRLGARTLEADQMKNGLKL
jgi:hypothetical protein